MIHKQMQLNKQLMNMDQEIEVAYFMQIKKLFICQLLERQGNLHRWNWNIYIYIYNKEEL